jgi:hypothetical protein
LRESSLETASAIAAKPSEPAASEFLDQSNCRVAETFARQIIDRNSKPKKIRDNR